LSSLNTSTSAAKPTATTKPAVVHVAVVHHSGSSPSSTPVVAAPPMQHTGQLAFTGFDWLISVAAALALIFTGALMIRTGKRAH
jgi:hypothetical protein